MHLPDIIDTNFLAVAPKELVGFAVAPGWVEALFGWGLRMQIGGRRSSACKVSLTPARGLGSRKSAGEWLLWSGNPISLRDVREHCAAAQLQKAGSPSKKHVCFIFSSNFQYFVVTLRLFASASSKNFESEDDTCCLIFMLCGELWSE